MASETSTADKNVNNTVENKAKILCIHGYRQNGDVFRQKTGALRKLLKKHVEFFFVTAPNIVPPLEPSVRGDDNNLSEQCGWWFSSNNKTFDSKQASEVCIGFEKSVSVITKAWEKDGPFHGLLGFSQGATFVSILCGMQEKTYLETKFSFAVLIAGFKSKCLPHDKYYGSEISIPSLHVFGETDQVIPKEMSVSLADHFEDPTILLHDGGHFVPASEPQKQPYISFILEQIKETTNEGEKQNKVETLTETEPNTSTETEPNTSTETEPNTSTETEPNSKK